MSLLDELSPYLRGVLTRHVYGPAIASVPFFNLPVHNLSEREQADVIAESNLFTQQIAAKLHPMVFSPNEMIIFSGDPAESMCVVPVSCCWCG